VNAVLDNFDTNMRQMAKTFQQKNRLEAISIVQTCVLIQ